MSARAEGVETSIYLAVDPVFYVPYSPSEARFEKRNLRKELAHCSPAITRNYMGNYDFFIIGDISSNTFGRVILASKGQRIIAEYDQGDAFVLRTGSCQMSTPAVILRQGPPFPDAKHSPYSGPFFNGPLSNDDLSKLMFDVLNRHAAAFGGKQKFLKWLHSWYNLKNLPYGIPQPLPGETLPDPLEGFTPLMKSILNDYSAG